MMFQYEGYIPPSSPLPTSKATWDEFFLDFCTYQHDMICPSHIVKDQIPRTEVELPISISRQVPCSPVIRQVSEGNFSQPDFEYLIANESRLLSQAEGWLFSTPKFPSWDSFLDSSKSSAEKFEPKSPLEDFSISQPDTGMYVPQNQAEIGRVELKRPIPRLAVDHAKIRKIDPKFFVTLHFNKKRLFLKVINFSGSEKEYTLPIFQELESLESMLQSGRYVTNKPTESYGNEILVNETGEKRYVSRLTRFQLAVVLGIQNYDISLVKDIETIVIGLCDQLCGLKIGESPWSKVPRALRKASVAKVHRFAKVFFPSFTVDNILTIIKRGAYSRTQEFLRRKRRRERRFLIEKKNS